MRCLKPLTVGFLSDGKTLAWSPKNYSKEYPTFQLPCGKCRFCRLEYARQWAIRCMHEAQMHQDNIFLTLTYNEENLTNQKLVYKDFQDFMKRLRHKFPTNEIGYFVTGEYGETKKRPHWHAIIFGLRPDDQKKHYTTDRGDTVYTSETIQNLWGKGNTEYGEVTFESAGYCARYAAKKLVHGLDGQHDYNPISKKSNKKAIGKKWLERYWEDIFNYGELRLQIKDKMVTCSIPRYYEKWLMKHNPSAWRRYVTQIKIKNLERAITINKKHETEWHNENYPRNWYKGYTLTHIQRQAVILDQRLNQLKNRLDTEL